ncbi:MAG: DNA alkylation repair protein [Candidatus Thorarchaeota archaeon]|nr:MAG: DNA alkylation repair protein [Candidatus Thorarchaeota archaeon]
MSSDTASAIIDDLGSRADLEKGKMVASYMKTSNLRFLGVSVTEARKVTRKHIRSVETDALIPLMKKLWKNEVFDYRLAAIEVMERYTREGDISSALELITRWIDDADTWSIIDPLCIVCLGNLIMRDRAVQDLFEDWRKSENFWRRRATIVPYVQLGKKRYHKPEYNDMILESLLPHLDDHEFFIAKAVGWVLRELSYREPELVRIFIRIHKDRMAKIAIREGSKRLPK